MGTSFGEGGELVAMSQAVCRLGVSEFLIRGERAEVIVHQEKKAWHAEEMRRGHPGVGRGLTEGGLDLEGNYGRLELLTGEGTVNIFNLEFKLTKKK